MSITPDRIIPYIPDYGLTRARSAELALQFMNTGDQAKDELANFFGTIAMGVDGAGAFPLMDADGDGVISFANAWGQNEFEQFAMTDGDMESISPTDFELAAKAQGITPNPTALDEDVLLAIAIDGNNSPGFPPGGLPPYPPIAYPPIQPPPIQPYPPIAYPPQPPIGYPPIQPYPPVPQPYPLPGTVPGGTTIPGGSFFAQYPPQSQSTFGQVSTFGQGPVPPTAGFPPVFPPPQQPINPGGFPAPLPAPWPVTQPVAGTGMQPVNNIFIQDSFNTYGQMPTQQASLAPQMSQPAPMMQQPMAPQPSQGGMSTFSIGGTNGINFGPNGFSMGGPNGINFG